MAGRFGDFSNRKPGLLGGAPGMTSQHGEEGSGLGSRVFVANVPVDLVEKLHLHSRFSKYGIVTGW